MRINRNIQRTDNSYQVLRKVISREMYREFRQISGKSLAGMRGAFGSVTRVVQGGQGGLPPSDAVAGLSFVFPGATPNTVNVVTRGILRAESPMVLMDDPVRGQAVVRYQTVNDPMYWMTV